MSEQTSTEEPITKRLKALDEDFIGVLDEETENHDIHTFEDFFEQQEEIRKWLNDCFDEYVGLQHARKKALVPFYKMLDGIDYVQFEQKMLATTGEKELKKLTRQTFGAVIKLGARIFEDNFLMYRFVVHPKYNSDLFEHVKDIIVRNIAITSMDETKEVFSECFRDMENDNSDDEEEDDDDESS
jgi:hypothetical protein